MNKVEQIKKIHSTPTKLALAIAGGGAEVIGELLRHGQGSNTLLEAIVPYNQKSFEGYIGGPPDKFVSEDTACQLAMAAWQRGLRLNDTSDPVIGIGATCSLAKENEREGREHRIWIARQSSDKCVTLGFNVLANRETEETIVADAILNEVAIGCGLWSEGFNGSLGRHWQHYKIPANIAEVFMGVANTSIGNSYPSGPRKLIFPGSFNPFHDGHINMAESARKLCPPEWKDQDCVHYEISVRNVDKPWLTYKAVFDRSKNYETIKTEHTGLCFTNAPTFVKKAEVFPGCTFIVGYDTFSRICDCKYYKDEHDRKACLKALEDADVHWIVFPRKKADGTISTEEDVMKLPDILTSRCLAVSQAEYEHSHLSSSAIRSNNEQK